MQARVIVQFDGARDGEIYPRTFKPGETVEGDLAAVAVREKWAEEIKPVDHEAVAKARAEAAAREKAEAEAREKAEAEAREKAEAEAREKAEAEAREKAEAEAREKAEAEAAERRSETRTEAVPIPEGWAELKAAELVKLARDLGAPADVTTKAEATAFIEAEIAKRAASVGA